MSKSNLALEAKKQGLTGDELDRIIAILGREPNGVELGIFAVMWSEHCCYKSSKIYLRNFPTQGPRVLQGPGENAGLIDIGDDDVLAFKIESHNHPSFIEPYQGAATGVGGILRDIFTMGARPIAVLDSLHFGNPTHPKTSFLFHGVVGGVGGYGNCIGIPNVGGEVSFDDSYNGNNLVNAMAAGILKRGEIHKGVAKGPGNRVLYLGSSTGRDGIHGATMASEEFGEGSEERRPTVQVGDPFAEKLLMEASLEIMREKLVVGIQDMGAAGITCSTFEMSARGGVGMKIDLDAVPLRDRTLTPFEIFLSESQERMLLVAEPGKVDRILEIAKKWDIPCVDIGEVILEPKVVAFSHGEKVIDLPVAPITDEAPVYERPVEAPKVWTRTIPGSDVKVPLTRQMFLEFLARPNVCSRAFVYEQYDQEVGTDTVVPPGSDAAILRIKGKREGVAITVDSNAFFCQANPYLGALHVMAEAVRNLACSGAKALAMTDCLNFGNPEIPSVMGQFKETVRGLIDACNHFKTPVTGGNVSLYNQTGEASIKPTPVIGMVGLIEDHRSSVPAQFTREGLEILLLGTHENLFYQSEFARAYLSAQDLACPPIDLARESALCGWLIEASEKKWIESAHDCSLGGLLACLAESCSKGVGASIRVPDDQDVRPFLFGEYASRAIVTCDEKNRQSLFDTAKRIGIHVTSLGVTGGTHLRLDGILDLSIDEMQTARERFFQEL